MMCAPTPVARNLKILLTGACLSIEVIVLKRKKKLKMTLSYTDSLRPPCYNNIV